MKLFSFCFLTCLLCSVSMFGCGSRRPPGLPKLTACELTVQFDDGSPVENVIVMLYPVEGKWYSNGKTNSAGIVKVAVNGSFYGVVPGEYKVTVKKQEVTFPPNYNPESENSAEAVVHQHIAEEFMLPNKTPLQITVGTSPVKEILTVKKSERKKN
ncbi:MAG: carboxypeptidase-like regulatory domain-containing protein [Planctomycetaceae bacterium]|nr:carboxypeptidase-like regulatory domain-containing protein [Planctomycetaceae bacterium]